MTTLANVRDILQHFNHQHIVLHSDDQEIIIATAHPCVADLRAKLDHLHGITCTEQTVLSPVSIAIVLIWIRLDQ